MKKKLNIIYLFLIVNILNIENASGSPKYCEIKFGEKSNEEALEKSLNIAYKSKFVREKNNFDCYQIGLEHDQKREPINEKPIFACCQSI